MFKIAFIFISTALILVIASPVPQAISVQTCPYQQNGYYNQPITIPVILQQPPSKNNPCNQPVMTQNQVQSQENPSNNNINHILVSKILSNPSLQKILDPNTKLYNQNGDEIKRQVPNTGMVPNVINNYFIVPPEFLNLNETFHKKDVSPANQIIRPQTGRVVKAKSSGKNIQINASKRQDPPENGNTATYLNSDKINENDIIPIDQRHSKTDKRKRNHEKNNTQSKSESEIDNDYIENGERRRRRRKQRKRKKEKQNADEKSIEIVEEEISRKAKEEPISEDCRDQNTKAKKRRRKLRPKTSNQEEYNESTCPGNKENINYNIPSNLEMETFNLAQNIQDKTCHVKDTEVTDMIQNDKSQLKDIEKPIENTEHEQEPSENRLTRNSKTESSAKDFRSNYAGVPNDMFRGFFPYMPFYPSGNFPLGYDQFLQSLQLANSGRNDADSIKRKKQKRNRKNQNSKNQQQTQNISSSLSENSELNSTPRTETTADPIIKKTSYDEMQTNVNCTGQIELNSKCTEKVLEVPMEVPHKVFPTLVDTTPETAEEYDIKPQLKEQKYKLHDFMIPELGIEDLLPSINRNGIISDYYPVFNDDDAYFSSNEDYYVQNLENERYFYTTDKNLDKELNRDRRKHDRLPTEEIQKSSKNARDRNNHFHNSERDDLTPRYRKFDKPIAQKLHQNDNTQVKTRRPIYESEEIVFRSPPILEFPDFKSRKIQKEFIKPDTDNYDEIVRFADDFAYKSSTYSDVKTPQYNTRVKPNTDVERVRVPPRNTKPKTNNVETVFAQSKVAKYGQTSDDSEEESSTPLTYSEEDEPQYYSDGDTTYVLAKSLHHDDYW